MRCGFLEAVRRECLKKEFPIRSIPLVKGPGNWRENDEPEFNSPKNTKGFCFLMPATRFREARCGFLEAACQECQKCLEKEFSIRSILLVKSPGNWRENYEPRV